MKPKTLAPLFPVAPEDLSTLDKDALSALESDFKDVARRIAADDRTLLGEPGTDEFTPGESVIEQMTNGVVELERIRAALASIDEAEAAYNGGVADLAAKFGLEDVAEDAEAAEALAAADAAADEDDADAEKDDEPEAEASAEDAAEVAAEAEAVTASATVVPRRPAVPATHRPRITVTNEPAPAALLASAGFESLIRPGVKLDRAQLAVLFGEAQRTVGRPSGGRDKVVLASAHFDFPPERTLTDDPNENDRKIKAVTSPEAVLASGGFCAPYPARYDLPFISSAATPVEDALPTFGAPRGGIQYPTPLGISDVSDGITIVTAAQDEAGGSDSIKNCVVIDCDPFQTAEVEAIAACVKHGNMNARAWPERVGNVTDLLTVASAQASETELLAAMTLASTAVNDEAKYGAYSTLIQGILKGAARYRSRHRMDPNVRLRAMFPAWTRELIAADLAHNQDSRLSPEAAVGAVEAFLSRAGVNISWYMDQDGTTTQVYGGESTNLGEFFTTVAWYLFHEGMFGVLDMGRLDIGLVRDSDLNSTNDFEVFYERFLGLAAVGIESLKIISTVCPNGATAAPATAFSC